MSLRDDLLPDVDDIRAIPGEMGLHRFAVYVRRTEWSGTRVGHGTKSVTETRLLVGGQNPHVREVGRGKEDVVAGTPELASVTYEIGPLTPEFAGGGTDPDVINPEKSALPGTTLYRLTGPGLPTNGVLCRRTDDDTTTPFRYMVRVRTIGRRTPEE